MIKLLVLILSVCICTANSAAAEDVNQRSFKPQEALATPSFFGQREIFYQFAPHSKREDLNPNLVTESGRDKAAVYVSSPQSGMVLSGKAPTLATAASDTQARQALVNQVVPHPLLQREISIYSNPLLNSYGPPLYATPFLHVSSHNPSLNGINPETFNDRPYMTGATFASDLVQHCLRLASAARTAEKILDPNLQTAEAAYQGATQQAADASSGVAGGAFDANLASASSPLINVANEFATNKANAHQANRTISQAIWIVQQMYKTFFLPLGVLLLLVGAVLSQTVNFVKGSFVNHSTLNPLEGLLRAVVAIFLLCAIQLIVGYAIDIGNALTDAVKRATDFQAVQQWSNEITNLTGNMTQAQRETRNRTESTASSTTRLVFGVTQALLNIALMVLTVYQLVMVCYLFLLGPVAAAMFAWPRGVGSLFQPVFANWLNGLSELVLWRFWWCVILLCMATRVQWLKDVGSYNPASAWEPIVYTAFMVMLAYVPFAALDFRPGDMVESLLEKAASSQG